MSSCHDNRAGLRRDETYHIFIFGVLYKIMWVITHVLIWYAAEKLLFRTLHVMQHYAEPLLEQRHKCIDILLGILLEKLQQRE